MALRRGGRFRAKHPKRPHAEARQCSFRPLPSIPDFAEYAGVYPRGSAVNKRHRPRMHSPLPIWKRKVGKTELGETHARSIFETDPAATDDADTIQARRYKNRGCPPPRTSALASSDGVLDARTMLIKGNGDEIATLRKILVAGLVDAEIKALGPEPPCTRKDEMRTSLI